MEHFHHVGSLVDQQVLDARNLVRQKTAGSTRLVANLECGISGLGPADKVKSVVPSCLASVNVLDHLQISVTVKGLKWEKCHKSGTRNVMADRKVPGPFLALVFIFLLTKMSNLI
jgi:hypothetical protein